MSIDKKRAIEFLCTVTHKSQLLNVLQASKLLEIEDDEGTQLIPKIPLETNIIYGYRAKNEEIEELKKIQLCDSEDDLVDKSDIFLSSKEQADVTRWQKVTTPFPDRIKAFKSQLSADFPTKKIYTDAPTRTEPSSKTLKWVASTYRALVKKESNDKERIPAWCNIAMSNLIEDGETENTVCVLSPAKNTIDTPLPFAFIRDGKRGLRAHEIYKKQGYLWRAGIALTDLLGFTQELDKYAEIEVDTSQNSPIEQVLKSSLRKLNGSVYWAHQVGEFDNQDSIPPRIERTLKFLSNFPDEKRSENQSAFALLSELESSLMRERIRTSFRPENNGELPSLYSRALRSALAKVPISWFESFNYKLPASNEERKEPAFWSSLFSLFESDLFDTQNTFERVRGSALLGCIYNYIESLLKGVVFEQEAINRIVDTNYDDLDLAGITGFEDTTLVLGEELNNISSLVEYFKKLIELNTPQTKFNKITTAGWLVLALIKIKFIVTDNRVYSQNFKNIEAALGGSSILVNLLTKSSANSANKRENWPIEYEPQASGSSPLKLDTKNALVDTFSQIKAFLKLLDPIYSEQNSVRLDDIESKHFNYNSSKNKYLERWEINKWQVNITGGDKPYTKLVKGELLSDWVETTTEDSRPIYVSLLSARYGLIENTFSFDEGSSSSELASEERSNVPVDSPQQNSVDNERTAQNQSENKNAPIERAKNNNNDRKESLVKNKDQENTTDNANDGFNFNRSSFYESQAEGWNRRGNTKSPSHIRAAFLQLRLNDKLGCGYEFPNFDDKEKDEKGIYEKEERRRQAILQRVLETCAQLKVEYLVLPEYSVQQDTIIWLKSKLKNSGISILAGTYRYSPNTYPDREYELKKGCLGTKTPLDLKGGEAVLTLLVPHSNDVILLNRTKKYASPASNELINPSSATLKPLFTFESFLDEVKASDKTLKKVKSSLKKMALLNGAEDLSEELSLIHDYVDSKVALKLEELKQLWNESCIRPLNFIQELICAELFLLTNPTNHNDLDSERIKLGNHFGTPITEGSDIKVTLEDLKSISSYLSRQGKDKDPYRRSIISIPAMTTRTEDYWLFGQSAMLANGFSTIFCNAVSNGHGKGGSCFIGLDSWLENKSSNDLITPYHGWGKGIYYGKSSEALGEETALVIADIDPLMMSQGKPRPQATPVPMRLVGYLPIIEHKSKNLLKDIENALVNLKDSISTLSNKDLSLDDYNELKEAVESFLSTDKHSDKATKERIEHWEKNLHKHPMSGLPGALTDWIAVDVQDE